MRLTDGFCVYMENNCVILHSALILYQKLNYSGKVLPTLTKMNIKNSYGREFYEILILLIFILFLRVDETAKITIARSTQLI